MGFGASLAFIAIGAILAFATRFEISGIDLQMIGGILIAVGVAGAIITLMYTRPRRRRRVVEAADPMYVDHDETPPHVHTGTDPAAAPHVHSYPDGDASQTRREQPGPRYPA